MTLLLFTFTPLNSRMKRLGAEFAFEKMSFFWFVSKLLALIFKTKLNCFISISFNCFLLKNNVWSNSNYCYRDHFSCFQQKLRHFVLFFGIPLAMSHTS